MDVEGTDSRKLKTKELAWWDRIGGQLVDIFASCFLVARYRWKNYLLVVTIISGRISRQEIILWIAPWCRNKI